MLGMGREDEDVDSEVGTVVEGNSELEMEKNMPLQFWSLQKSQKRGAM